MSRVAVAMCSAVLLAGCAAEPIYVPLSPWHPANPCAEESRIPPPSATLAVHARELMPPHPDWQIPSIRDNEMHGHATGRFPMSGMPMDHSMGHSMGRSPKREAGMVKMEAPEHVVDYAPADAHPAPDAAMPEHEPERHLDHTFPERREAPTQQAPIAPSGKKQMTPMEDHTGHSVPPAEAPDESTGAGEDSTPSGHQNH